MMRRKNFSETPVVLGSKRVTEFQNASGPGGAVQGSRPSTNQNELDPSVHQRLDSDTDPHCVLRSALPRTSSTS
jgi:hypothetical protein